MDDIFKMIEIENYCDEAESLLEKNEHQLAIGVLSKAIEIDPNYAKVYELRGRAYLHNDELKKAEADLIIALKLDEFAGTYNNLGIIYNRQGSLEKAKEHYDKAIRLIPDEAIFYCNRGLVYFDMKDFKSAINDFSQAIELNPNDELIYAWRGEAYAFIDDYQNACADWNRSLKLNLSVFDLEKITVGFSFN